MEILNLSYSFDSISKKKTALVINFVIFWVFHPILKTSKLPKYYRIVCLLFIASRGQKPKTENIVQKITQPKWQKTKNQVTKICDDPGICDNCVTIWHFHAKNNYVFHSNIKYSGVCLAYVWKSRNLSDEKPKTKLPKYVMSRAIIMSCFYMMKHKDQIF